MKIWVHERSLGLAGDGGATVGKGGTISHAKWANMFDFFQDYVRPILAVF